MAAEVRELQPTIPSQRHREFRPQMPREWRSPLKFQVGVASFDATGAAVAVELVEAFLPANLDVFGEAARGQLGVAFDDGLDDCGVLRVDMLELSDAVTEAAHLEDADQ